MSLQHEQRRIEFQLANSGHALEMVNFHNSYYGTNRTPDHWLWEYGTYNPEQGVFTFAKDFDKIIATQAMIPIYLEIGSKSVLSGKSENTLLLPGYRGTEIMQNLYEYAVKNCTIQGMKLIWGFTDAVKAFHKFGFTSYPDIQLMTRPGNIWVGIKLRLGNETPLWRRFASIGKLILKDFFIRNSRTIPRFHGKGEYELKKGVCDELSLEGLYKRLRSQHKSIISIKYDDKYFRWRIREHPFIKYNEYQVYHGADLRGYAIVGLLKGIVSISDLTAEDGYSTFLLLNTILKNYYKEAVEFQFLGNRKDFLSQAVFEQLGALGFSVSGNFNFVLRDLTEVNNEGILDIRNWHINGLWTEGYSM